MKNLTFIMSLCAILSASTLYSMKRSADYSLESSLHLKSFYTYTCTYQGCNKSFAMESNLDEHTQEHHGIKRKKNTTGMLCNPKHSHSAYSVTIIDDATTTQSMNEEIIDQEETISETDESIHPLLRNNRTLFSSNVKEEENLSETNEWVSLPVLATVVAHYALIMPEPVLATAVTKPTKNNALKKFHCTFEGCDKSFKHDSNLSRHRQTHTDEKHYTCTFDGCGKSFTRSDTLTAHMQTHTGKKPYACTFEGCNQSFARSSTLSRHMQIHTDERPYPCTFEGCNKSLSSNSELIVHLRRHTKENPYACTVKGCNKAFTLKGDFNRHVQTHNKEKKPHACTLCDKSFALHNSLTRHIKEKHLNF